MECPMDIADFDAVLFDLDGTIYQGDELIDGADRTVGFFRAHGKKVMFFTNNSEKGREFISEKLNRLGIDCTVEDVMAAGHASALYAKTHGLDDVYVCGSDDFKAAFEDVGLRLADESDAAALFIGMDQEFDYDKLAHAVRAALHADVIIACNKDKLFPKEGGVLYPGCGSIVAPIEWCSGKECDFLIGKPNTVMFDFAKDELNCESKRILVIGDSYSSDIQMAKNAGALHILIGETEDNDVVSVTRISDIIRIFS